jgi:hypothetical protein
MKKKGVDMGNLMDELTTTEWVRFCEDGEEPCPRSIRCDYCYA